MINFVTGKPGAGKSLWAVRLVVDELRHTRRIICTNLALKLPELAQYLHDNYGETFDMRNRIRILSAAEVCEFWLYTKDWTGFGLPRVKLAETSRGKVVERPDLSGRYGDPGVLYLLDELHEYFGARNWQTTGEDALFYLSQHRKLGDDVVCITQAFQNVDKQFRSVAQDFTVLRNIGVEQLGWFRLPKRILRSTFLSPPTGNEQPAVRSVMSIDVQGLCQCYDTAAGVGVVGKYADTGKKLRGGIPWQVFVVVCVLAFALLFALPKIAKAFANGVAPTLTPGAGTNAPAAAVSPAQPVAESSVVQQIKPADREQPDDDEEPPLEIIGWAQVGRRAEWFLSDGSVVPSNEAGPVLDTGVIIDGRLVRFQKKGRGAARKEFPHASPVVHQPAFAAQPYVPVQALANPGAVSGPKRIRIAGFDGKPWAVRSIGGDRSFDGQDVRGVGESFVGGHQTVEHPEEEPASSGR